MLHLREPSGNVKIDEKIGFMERRTKVLGLVYSLLKSIVRKSKVCLKGIVVLTRKQRLQRMRMMRMMMMTI